jgi:hypothetical protein
MVIAGSLAGGKLLFMTFSLSALRKPRGLDVALLTLGVLMSGAAQPSFAQKCATAPAAVTLPSGLAPVCQMEVAGMELALDGNGSLYRSDNQGKHWKQIKQQWDGKATELLGIPPLTAAPGSGDAPRPDDTEDTGKYAAVLLRSSASLHWVSVDRGKTWKPSTIDDVRRNDVKWSGQ